MTKLRIISKLRLTKSTPSIYIEEVRFLDVHNKHSTLYEITAQHITEN